MAEDEDAEDEDKEGLWMSGKDRDTATAMWGKVAADTVLLASA
jgi:hypothetical protein